MAMTRAPANKQKLTEFLVQQLSAKAKPFCVWDTLQKGLVLRIQPSGHRAFKVIYSQNGRSKWLTLGDAKIVPLSEARKMAAKVLLTLIRGGDPVAEWRHRRNKQPQNIIDKWHSFAKDGVEPTCFLYRHFNASGDLLYVGMSLHVRARQAQHLKRAAWANTIYQIVIEPFASREELLEAEQLAIRTEFPKFNRVHNERQYEPLRAALPLTKIDQQEAATAE
jgi:hypothetical protein